MSRSGRSGETGILRNYLHVSLMKQQLVTNHRCTVLQETEETLRVSRPSLRMSCFYENVRSRFFCGRGIMTGRVFVTHLSNIVVITVRRIVWVAANCCVMSQIWLTVQAYVCVCVCMFVCTRECSCDTNSSTLEYDGPQHDREEEQKDSNPAW